LVGSRPARDGAWRQIDLAKVEIAALDPVHVAAIKDLPPTENGVSKSK
jgi:hypothetical protein